MRVLAPSLWLTVAAAFLTGCAGQGQPPQQYPSQVSSVSQVPAPEGTALPRVRVGPVLPGWLSPEAQKPKSDKLLYVAAETANDVLIYPETSFNHSPIGMISSGVSSPYGLYVDQSENLYVVNDGGPSVAVYAPGSTSASTTYSQGLTRPLYVIADQNGDVFVSNASRGCTTTVVEYQPGSQQPYLTYPIPGPEADGIDFDQQGNLYVAYRSCTKHRVGSIVRFAPGSTQGQSLRIRARQPQGLIVDNKGNILLTETDKWATVDFIRPGKRYPEFRLKLPDDEPVELAMTADQSKLFVSSYSGYVYETRYPIKANSSWTQVDQVGGTPQGIALSNGQTF